MVSKLTTCVLSLCSLSLSEAPIPASSVASSVIKSLSSSHGTINMVGGNQYNAQTIQIFGMFIV